MEKLLPIKEVFEPRSPIGVIEVNSNEFDEIRKIFDMLERFDATPSTLVLNEDVPDGYSRALFSDGNFIENNTESVKNLANALIKHFGLETKEEEILEA